MFDFHLMEVYKMEVTEFCEKRIAWFESDVDSLIQAVKNGNEYLIELYRQTIIMNFKLAVKVFD